MSGRANSARRRAEPVGAPQFVGPWSIEPDGAAGPALRRADPAVRPESSDPDWDPVEFVPGAGTARRVVVLGESTARGWPFEAFLSPTSVLERNLAGCGDYQCVDLAKVGADGDLLAALAGMLPAVRPDVVVSLAGNNWTMPPPTGGHGHRGGGTGPFAGLAEALREGGYAGLRAAGVARATAAAQVYLDRLLHLHRSTGAGIVMVVTEFNLAGFGPPEDMQTPVLPAARLARWHRLRSAAERALAAGDTDTVAVHAAEMTALDDGCSPVPGWLAGRAAVAAGDGARARACLEQSRDSVTGLMLRHTPRTTRSIQDLVVAFAGEHGFACVDLRTVLADPDLPDVPDVACFHDYCHLSEQGILRAMAAVTDAVAGLPTGTTPPGPGLPSLVRAFGHARAAAHLAFQAQPVEVVAAHIGAALAEERALAPTLGDVRDVLSAPPPAWIEPAMGRLVADPRVGPFVGAMAGRPGLAPELWTLRRSLDDELGPTTRGGIPARIDLLLEPGPDGHPLPNWTDAWAHHVSCAADSVLAFALDRARDLALTLELRTRWSSPDGSVMIGCNDAEPHTVAAGRDWRRITLTVPATATHAGVNRIALRWPVPDQDLADAIAEDAAALERGEFPMVLPVFGELYQADLHL